MALQGADIPDFIAGQYRLCLFYLRTEDIDFVWKIWGIDGPYGQLSVYSRKEEKESEGVGSLIDADVFFILPEIQNKNIIFKQLLDTIS